MTGAIITASSVLVAVAVGLICAFHDRAKAGVCRFQCGRCGITWESRDWARIHRIADVHDCIRQARHNER